MTPTSKKYILSLIIFSSSLSLFAQRNNFEAVFDTTALEGQFDYLYRRSSTYEEYKVMSIIGFNQLKKNSLDSISSLAKQITSNAHEINELKNELEVNNAQIGNLKTELSETQDSKDSISLLWMELSKGTYNFIMWCLVFILAGVSVILYLLYKKGHQVVRSTKTRLLEVQEDFENHRKNALTREQKLARELMDVKLKYKNR